MDDNITLIAKDSKIKMNRNLKAKTLAHFFKSYAAQCK